MLVTLRSASFVLDDDFAADLGCKLATSFDELYDENLAMHSLFRTRAADVERNQFARRSFSFVHIATDHAGQKWRGAAVARRRAPDINLVISR